MTRNPHPELQKAGRSLRRAARSVAILLWLAGAYSFLTTVRPILPDAPENLTWGERRVIGIVALVTLGGFGLAGWVAGRLLTAASESVEALLDGTDAAVRTSQMIEAHLVPGLNRAVAALERLAEREGQATRPGATRHSASAVREALHKGKWGRAERLLQEWARDHPADPEARTLAAELEGAREAAVADLRARLEAARAADDPGRVVACRDALTQHLRGEPLRALDRKVVRWLADWVRRREESGAVTAEVASVAECAAESFADTTEGAALLAALPGLRRRAGLCPRCARPFQGRSDADSCDDCRDELHDPPPRRRPAPGASPRGRPRP
jgi:hypothetical protein